MHGPKNNFNKFKKILNVEIFSKASPTSHNTEVFSVNKLEWLPLEWQQNNKTTFFELRIKIYTY